MGGRETSSLRSLRVNIYIGCPALVGGPFGITDWVVADVGQWRITRNRTIIPRRRRTINWGTKASVGHIGITWSSQSNTVSHISHSLVSRQFRGGAVVHLFANTTELWRLMEQFAAYNTSAKTECSASKNLNPAKVIFNLWRWEELWIDPEIRIWVYICRTKFCNFRYCKWQLNALLTLIIIFFQRVVN